jgi:LysR family hydrogen peroxide-inducible transcriptional activator
MNRISLKHLRYFEVLATHGHFRRAAEACAISQPALSLQMKELEDILGAPLIERSSRQVRLTGLGETFAERARTILRAVDELGSLARASGEPLSGQVRLGVIATVAPYLLPGAIKALGERFPDLDLRPREAITRRLIGDLMAGRLDAAVVALPVPEPGLAAETMFEEEFVLVRPQSAAGEAVPSAEALKQSRLLLLEEGHCFRDQALSFCKMGPTVNGDILEASSLTTLVQMVGAGIGMTLIPQIALPIEMRSAPVSVARLPVPRPSRTIGMVWRRSNPLGDQFITLAGVLREVAMDLKVRAQEAA